MADQLGFFSTEAASSSESEEDRDEEEESSEEEAGEKSKAVDKGPHSGVRGDEGEDDKLPSPDTLFKTVKRPEFLNMDEDIDWYDMITKRDQDSDAFYALSSVPPPASLYSKPVRYSSGEKRPKSAVDGEDGTVNEDLEENKAKKEKINEKKDESFKQKEKRKRDLGQASRGKSYVEEEKRILREGYSSGAGLGFD